MPKAFTGQELMRARLCVEVLRAVQKDARTSGWYRGEVRGQAAIGAATMTLEQKGLLQPASGAQPFRLTKKGQEFVKAHIKDWESFMTKLDHPGRVEKIANALKRVATAGK